MYDADKVPIFKLPPDAHQMRERAQGRQKRHIIDDERMERVLTAKYFGAVTNVDDNVGRILAELERQGMMDNTIILFSADHGNMLGQKARWFKGLQYDGSAGIPLLWRGPKGAPENTGRVENRIVENIDIMPTLLAAAGLPVPEGVQGRSFLPLARGADPNWKDRCFSQLQTGMVRTPQWKLIDNSLNLSGDLELYDMRSDPHEERNVARDAKNRDLVADLSRQLTRFRADQPAPVKIPGMPAPAYSVISDKERKELVELAPG